MKYSNYILMLFCGTIVSLVLAVISIYYHSANFAAVTIAATVIFATAMLNAPEEETFRDYNEWEKRNSNKGDQ